MSELPETISVTMGGHDLIARADPNDLDDGVEYVQSAAAHKIIGNLNRVNADLARKVASYERAEAEDMAEAMLEGTGNG